MSSIQRTLVELQQRIGLVRGNSLTYQDMAKVAGTSHRTMSEWMRGATAPQAMSSMLNLLSALPAGEAAEVIAHWKASVPNTHDQPDRSTQLTRSIAPPTI